MIKAIKILVILIVFITNQSCEKDNDIELTGSIELTTRTDFKYYLYTEQTFLIKEDQLDYCDCALRIGVAVGVSTLEITDLNPGTYYISYMPIDYQFGDKGENIQVIQVSAGMKRKY